jgi:hypothetical protein
MPPDCRRRDAQGRLEQVERHAPAHRIGGMDRHLAVELGIDDSRRRECRQGPSSLGYREVDEIEGDAFLSASSVEFARLLMGR